MSAVESSSSSAEVLEEEDENEAIVVLPKRRCRKCKEMKPGNSFRYRNMCGTCYYKLHQLKARKEKDAACLAEGLKKCDKCGDELPCSEFNWYCKADNVLQKNCRECQKLERKAKRVAVAILEDENPSKKPKRGHSASIPVDSGATVKFCDFHQEEHPIEEFRIQKNKYTGCKKAEVEKAKLRRQEIQAKFKA